MDWNRMGFSEAHCAYSYAFFMYSPKINKELFYKKAFTSLIVHLLLFYFSM